MQHRPCCSYPDPLTVSESLTNAANSVEGGLLGSSRDRPTIIDRTPTSVKQVAGSSRSGSPLSRSNVDQVEKPEAESVGKDATGKPDEVSKDATGKPDEVSKDATEKSDEVGKDATGKPDEVGKDATGKPDEVGKDATGKPDEVGKDEAEKVDLAAEELANKTAESSIPEKSTFEVDFDHSLFQKRIPAAGPVPTATDHTGATAETPSFASAQGASSGSTAESGEVQSAKSAETRGVVSSGATTEMETSQRPKSPEMQGAVSATTTELEAQQTAKPAERQGASSGSTMETIELELHLGAKSVGTQAASLGPRPEQQIPQSANALSGSQGTSSGSSLETMELEVPHSATPAAGTQDTSPGGKQRMSSESAKEVEVPKSASLGSTLETSSGSAKKLQELEGAKPDEMPESISESTKELEVPQSAATPLDSTKTVSSGSIMEMPASANPDDKTTKEGQESETKEEASMDTHGEADDEWEMPVQEEESPCPQKQPPQKRGQEVQASSHNVKKPREVLVLGQLSVMVIEVIESAMAVPLSCPVLGDILENQHRYRSIAVRCGCELVFSRRVVVKRTVKWVRYAILILRGPTDVAVKRFRGLLEAYNTQFKKAIPYDTEKPRARLLTSEQLPDNLELAVCAERTGRSVVGWERLPLEMPQKKLGAPLVKEQNLMLPNNEATRRVLTYLYPGWGFQESKPIPNNRVYDMSVDAAEALEKQQKLELKQGGGTTGG